MTPTETQIKYTEAKIERRLDEHTQMAVMLESCFFMLNTLGTLGGLQAVQSETCIKQARKIEALLAKVNTK